MSLKNNFVRYLAIFPDMESAVEACKSFRENGFTQKELSVVSEYPIPEGVFPVHEPRCFLQWITLIAGVFGIALGILLTFGTALLYPIRTGHMPILSVPPYAIISYEIMMLSAIVSTVIGFVIATLRQRNRHEGLSDPLIQKGYIGILIFCKDEAKKERIIELFKTIDPMKILRTPEGLV